MDLRASTTFRREAASVPSARAFIGHALRSAGVAPDIVDRMVLAVAEACNNAILHAEGDVFTVGVALAGTTCTLTVSDLGQGFYPPTQARMPSPSSIGRRGLPLMEALVDHVKVTSSAAGTTVVLVQDVASARPERVVAER